MCHVVRRCDAPRMFDDRHMHQAVVVTGPPGAGKSSVSDHLVSLFDPSACVAGDLFFGFVRNGSVDPWLAAADDQNKVIIEAAALAVGRLTQRFDVVYDGVVGPWYLPTFVEVSGLEVLHYAVLMPPLSVCMQRVDSRVGHGFTDLEATEHMWRDFDRSTTGSERHVLIGTGSPAEIAQQIRERVTSGSLRYEARNDQAP
jgi:cytidylate kinase